MLQHSLSFRMKEVYEERKAGEDLDAEYGNNVGGPPKNRRAGGINKSFQCLARDVLKDIRDNAMARLQPLQKSGFDRLQVEPQRACSPLL